MDDYIFYSLWPLREQLKNHNPWDHMIPKLYQLIADSEIFYSPCQSLWLNLVSNSILSPDILSVNASGESPPKCVVEAAEKLQYPLIYLPTPYQELLPQEIIEDCTLNEQAFLDNFFTKVTLVPKDIRNEVLLLSFQACALGSKHYIEKHLKSEDCVPCTPDGKCIKKCSEIVDPCASFSSLYHEDDGVFPFHTFHENSLVHSSMQMLGMIHNHLPWPMILERARTIQSLYLYNHNEALKRSAMVLNCITQHVLVNASNGTKSDDLVNVAFLPVMKRPEQYPKCFRWFGQDQTLLCGNNLVKGGASALLAGSEICLSLIHI